MTTQSSNNTTRPRIDQGNNNKQDKDLEATRVNLFLHAENTRIFCSPAERQLPVTIVTGRLGSGKTTLLKHILTSSRNLKIAAAVNDFAELNIDERLIRHTSSKGNSTEIVELSNGCVCCHLLGDLQEAVWKMLDPANNSSTTSEQDISYLVIETSGVTDPTSVIRSLDAKFGKLYRARLDSVVTVVDADTLLHSTTNSASSNKMTQTEVTQIQCADVVLINKVDLIVAESEDKSARRQEALLSQLKAQIRSLNDTAVIHTTKHCHIPLSDILDVHIPSNHVVSEGAPISHEATQVPIYVSATGGALRSLASRQRSVTSSNSSSSSSSAVKNNYQQHNTDTFVSASISNTERPLSLQKLHDFLTGPAQALVRMKGVLWIQELRKYRCVVHLSGRGRLGFALEGKWTGPPSSEIALIGKRQQSVASNDNDDNHMDIIIRAFYDCLAEGRDVKALSGEENSFALQNLQQYSEFFDLVENQHDDIHMTDIQYFRLTGTKVYGYTEEEIERNLRIDTNAMNQDLVDAVNASADSPKAFLAYTYASPDSRHDDSKRIILCLTHGTGEPANNLQVLVREAKTVLTSYFRNVQTCKCGA